MNLKAAIFPFYYVTETFSWAHLRKIFFLVDSSLNKERPAQCILHHKLGGQNFFPLNPFTIYLKFCSNILGRALVKVNVWWPSSLGMKEGFRLSVVLVRKLLLCGLSSLCLGFHCRAGQLFASGSICLIYVCNLFGGVSHIGRPFWLSLLHFFSFQCLETVSKELVFSLAWLLFLSRFIGQWDCF